MLLPQLSENFLFASVSADDMRLAINTMTLVTVATGTTVITQGDSGDKFYVIEEGTTRTAVLPGLRALKGVYNCCAALP